MEKSLANEIKTKPKSFWKYAKSQLKTKPGIPALNKADGTKEKTAKEKAGALNKFFISVFTLEDNVNMPKPKESNVAETLSTINITPEMVREKLRNLNPDKSPGDDRWHPYFLKELADVICVPLTILFNKSLNEGAHTSWLKAVITPIYKKGQRNQ